MIDPSLVHEFLAGHRIAVVGASPDPTSIGNTVFKEFQAHGYDTVPVNPNASEVEGVTCHPDLAAVPGDLDGVVVMLSADKSAQIVRDAAERGVKRVWLFKGFGPGAVSEEAVAAAETRGVTLIPGACPLMFLEPVGWFHKVHRTFRHINGSVARAA